MTHCRSEMLAPRSVWIDTSATFTMVMSSSRMKTPRHTATRVHHFGSRPAAGPASVAGTGASVVWSVMPAPWSMIVNDLTITLSDDTPDRGSVKNLIIHHGRECGRARPERDAPPARARRPPGAPGLAGGGPGHRGAR